MNGPPFDPARFDDDLADIIFKINTTGHADLVEGYLAIHICYLEHCDEHPADPRHQ